MLSAIVQPLTRYSANEPEFPVNDGLAFSGSPQGGTQKEAWSGSCLRLARVSIQAVESSNETAGVGLAMRILGIFSLVSFLTTAHAQIPSVGVDSFQAPPDPRWSRITQVDVDAAYQLLLDNHPGAALELGDIAFQQRLIAAHLRALKRARGVTSYQGYLFALAGFATDMGDKHIWSRPTFVVNLPRWPDFIVSKRGETWSVTDTELDQSALLGASLLSCDGEDVKDLARVNLGGFRAVWNIGAQQIQNAPWLMVDEGNPFISRPKACTFEHNGQRQTVTLDWVRIKRESLLPRLKKAVGAGAAGYGVRKVGEGYWIALQDLQTDKARVGERPQRRERFKRRQRALVVVHVLRVAFPDETDLAPGQTVEPAAPPVDEAGIGRHESRGRERIDCGSCCTQRASSIFRLPAGHGCGHRRQRPAGGDFSCQL